MSDTQQRFIRNTDAADLLESFLISAIASVLLIRTYLHLTGFPQLGGHAIHIAHMLWGGALMLLALVLIFSFLGKRIMYFAAIIGGAGFGTFIDELGKYITRDNNYFFQPTIALLYLIFLLLFFTFRWLSQQRKLTTQEYTLNALRLLEEVALDQIDKEEYKQLVSYLRKSNLDSVLTQQLTSLASTVKDNVAPPPGLLSRYAQQIKIIVRRFTSSPWLNRGLITYFLAQSAISLLAVSTFILAVWHHSPTQLTSLNGFSVAAYGQLISTIASAAFSIIGSLLLFTSRLQALHMYRRAVLIEILITQFFSFYHQQLSAIFTLTLNLLILVTINHLLHQETQKQRRIKLQLDKDITV